MAKRGSGTRITQWTTKRHYPFNLTEGQREALNSYISSNAGSKTSRMHASILLMGDTPPDGIALGEQEIARALHLPPRIVLLVHRRFLEAGLEAGLHPCMHDNRHGRKMPIETEDRIIALAGSQPPLGYSRWSLRMLAQTMRKEGYNGNMSYELVRRVLKARGVRLGRQAS
jgi:hypothetical protein